MKTKKILIIVSAVLILSFILGAIGIVRLPAAHRTWKQEAEEEEELSLIGALITFKPLFDYSYVLEITEEDGKDRMVNRVYATFREKQPGQSQGSQYEYVFENIEGIPFFAPLIKDPRRDTPYRYMEYVEGIDVTKCHFSSNDLGESVTLEGTLLLAPERFPADESCNEEDYFICVNPVYQNRDGEVFAVPGDVHLLSQYAAESTWTFTQTHSLTETDMGSVSVSENVSQVAVTVNRLSATKEIKVRTFDSSVNYIGLDAVSPDSVESGYDTLPGAALLIVESSYESDDGTTKVSQKLVTKDDPDTAPILYYSDRGDGILCKKGIPVNWK